MVQSCSGLPSVVQLLESRVRLMILFSKLAVSMIEGFPMATTKATLAKRLNTRRLTKERTFVETGLVRQSSQ
jgi:hypothetical protein